MFRNSLMLAIFSLILFPAAPALAQPPGYTLCADENWVCFTGWDTADLAPPSGPNGTSIAYGANGSFVFVTAYGGIECITSAFGSDPAPGTAKACYVPTDPAGYIRCASDGTTCPLSGTNTVAFGSNQQLPPPPLPGGTGHDEFSYKKFTGNVACTSAAFYGWPDLMPGGSQNCFIPALPPNYDFCSAEGFMCSFGFNDAEIAFGANGNFVYRRFTNQTSTVCTASAFFGVDPSPGIPKQCFELDWSPLSYPSQPYGYSSCSAENGFCNFSGPLNVAYGANGNFVFRFFVPAYGAPQGVSCTNTVFGVDPAPGIVKACYIPTVPPGFTQCSNENGACYFLGTGAAPVAYGANGSFVFKNLTSGFGCNSRVFGKDPAPGTVKACYIPAGPPSYTFCSSENGTCNLSDLIGTEIFYGWNGAFIKKSFPLGANVACNNSTFGQDPAPGIVKACFAVPFTFQ